jgi:hypothetical protein
MSDPFNETDQAAKARRGRNIALAVGLLAFVAIVFIVTITRLGGNVTAHGF